MTWSVAETLRRRHECGEPADRDALQRTETLTYTLTGEAATSAFVIDSSTGQISVKQGVTLDYETKSSYTGRVTWSVQSQEAYVDLTIDVLDMPRVENLQVTRTRIDEHSNLLDHAPALGITWTDSTNGLTVSHYNYKWRKKGASEWTNHSVSAPVLRVGFVELEPGATYQTQVQAVAGSEVGPWSPIAEGRANRPPTGTEDTIVDGNFGWGGSSVTGMDSYFEDADGDPLTYWATSQYPGVIQVWIEMSGDQGHLWMRSLNPGSSKITYGVSDGYGGFATKEFTDIVEAYETRSVAENSPAGTLVGRAVQGTPYGDETLTHTLGGEALDYFVINSSTGQISVRQNATLDYETKSSYTGTVTWTVQGQTATVNLTINVTDLEAGKPDAPTVARTQFSEQSAPALDITWTKPASNGLTISWYELQYRKQAAAGQDPEEWTLYTGHVLETTSLRLSNLEAGAVYEFQVRAGTNEEGLGPWSDTGSGRTNRAPTATSAPFLAARSRSAPSPITTRPGRARWESCSPTRTAIR